MMLTRFALLAVVAVALASLTEAKKNACAEALKPVDFEQKISEWKTACEGSEERPKCMAEKHGWVTEAGVFDEDTFRNYITDKIAPASCEVKAHVQGAIYGCLTAERMEKFKIRKIMQCIKKDCPAAATDELEK